MKCLRSGRGLGAYFVDRDGGSSQVFLISLFGEKQAVVSNGSDYTIGHANLAPGEVINFVVALHDPEKLVKFVKVTPCVAEINRRL